MPAPSPTDAEPRTAEAAEAKLRVATQRRPPDPLAFLRLGDLLAGLGRYDEAVAVFEEGLALEPRAIILRVGLGYAWLNANDRAAARAQFQAVRAAAPERFDGMVGLAAVMALDGAYAAATELFRRALELQPDNAVTRISLARCLLEMGDRAAGEAALRAATAASPERAWPAITALAATPHGRVFLRPSAVAEFLGVKPD